MRFVIKHITQFLFIFSLGSYVFADNIINLNSPDELQQVSQLGNISNDSIENNKFLQLEELRRLGLIDGTHVNALLKKLYSTNHDGIWNTLKNQAQALRYGIPVHQAIEDTLSQQGGSRYLTRFAQFLGTFGAFKKHHTPFFNTAYSCGASPLVFHGPWPVPSLLGSSYPNSELKDNVMMMEECKLSETFNQNVRSGNSIEPELNRIVRHFDFNVANLAIQGNSEKEQIRNAIHQARNKEGMLILMMFTGAKKYQFYLIGAYQNKINLFYVLHDNRPTPVAVFSMPESQINENDLVDGIYILKNGKKERDRVPVLGKSAVLLSDKPAEAPFESAPEQENLPHPILDQQPEDEHDEM
ncbi:hypothetical protein GZ77_06505 [Endozoicomonas montiporae]|uniref:Uncharacterized protein n=2 Tax=Endozoicomonas montiporae TaxID=1027273 RepID=A0A081NCD1_9GAMM|nr:hypothetical protein [Endozoicomonas montiporae]KEQ16104.1 hypothetical protein GZ77_06505 [Endozoicomonas montiporae]